ncbi:hypothetical protein [Streptomyces sp. NRRL S-350]|uniref:hypothetical protein n=1 Tax=Streptomyces sp. NRRL S-350 TaxID=1463902 RepID=UPI000AFC0960|nr:hypothetical protein [Streptomyces sp. NRRL S-350]
MTLRTPDGGSVELVRYGRRVEMHLRAPDGRTVATVDMAAEAAVDLIAELHNP